MLEDRDRLGRIDDGELRQLVSDGAAALGFPLIDFQVERLVAYLRLIERWNATYNLTAIRNPRDMATQHIVDCLAAAAALERRRGKGADRVLDVGSGAGLPGVVVAIVSTEREVVCVDSVRKKSVFVTHVAGTLGLKNVQATHARIEDVAGAFDVISSRAFGSLSDFVSKTRHLLAESGVWMAMKGKPPHDEIEALVDVAFHVEPVAVPRLDADRCVVWMTPNGSEASARL